MYCIHLLDYPDSCLHLHVTIYEDCFLLIECTNYSVTKVMDSEFTSFKEMNLG
jgi:hypothetical protein